ncbi:MAG: hypothetical protein KDD25_01945 [Bdellovibrionales bacterium]|nr:hypothetical protein [Bdellovibrionales bacterium]
MKIISVLLGITSFVLISSGARAAEQDPSLDFYLHSVEVKDDVDVPELDTFSFDANCVENSAVFSIEGLSEIPIDEIINIGTKVWTLIEKNRPVVSSQLASASAMPAGIKCWQTLENWSAPKAKSYRYSYKNLFGVTVIDFEFKVVYSYGGQLDGKGKYLTNVQVLPTHVEVAWGYTFNAVAKIQAPINLGNGVNPVAGLESQMTWTIDTVVKHLDQSQPVFVTGNGEITTL